MREPGFYWVMVAEGVWEVAMYCPPDRFHANPFWLIAGCEDSIREGRFLQVCEERIKRAE